MLQYYSRTWRCLRLPWRRPPRNRSPSPVRETLEQQSTCPLAVPQRQRLKKTLAHQLWLAESLAPDLATMLRAVSDLYLNIELPCNRSERQIATSFFIQSIFESVIVVFQH